MPDRTFTITTTQHLRMRFHWKKGSSRSPSPLEKEATSFPICSFLWEPGRTRLQTKHYISLNFTRIKMLPKAISSRERSRLIKKSYFITTIPYDSHFEVLVDGKNVSYEKVNTAFLGFPLKQGKHKNRNFLPCTRRGCRKTPVICRNFNLFVSSHFRLFSIRSLRGNSK